MKSPCVAALFALTACGAPTDPADPPGPGETSQTTETQTTPTAGDCPVTVGPGLWLGDVGTGDVDTAAPIEGFCAAHPEVTAIRGSVRAWNTELEDFADLSCVEVICGDVTIGGLSADYWGDDIDLGNHGLTSLDGLHNLRVVHGSVQISNNPQLETLDGLASLEVVHGALSLSWGAGLRSQHLDELSGLTSVGQLSIIEMPNLVDTSGLAALRIDGGTSGLRQLTVMSNAALVELGLPGVDEPLHDLVLEANPGLVTLDLSALTSVDDLRIEDNPALTDLDGLGSLRAVGLLLVEQNPSLQDIQGLSGLTGVGGSLRMTGTGLADLTGLEGIVSVGDEVQIASNDRLLDIDALQGLTTVGWGVTVLYNPLLCASQVAEWTEGLTVGGEINTGGNDDGC